MSPLKHPASAPALPNLLSLHLFHFSLCSLTMYYTHFSLCLFVPLLFCCFNTWISPPAINKGVPDHICLSPCEMKYGMYVWYQAVYARQLPTVARRLKLTYIATKHKYSVRTRACFQYSMYPIKRCLMCVPSSCFINRVKKKPQPLCACQSGFLMHSHLKAWLNSSPHNLTQMSGEMRTGRSCSPKLQSTKYCAGLFFFFFSAGRASQTVPSDLRLKLDQLHTSLLFHAASCPLFFFFFFTCLIAVCLSPRCHNTLCHNSSPSLLLWNWISNKIPDRSLCSSDWLDSWLTCAEVLFSYIMWHNSRGVERSP